ncbi:MAG TPA: ABC transporter substrate-binding protein [Thermomicrobiales bacterium]|nr:ABC transporter substrate-binding protein [Thermomicrobiales bacterium]
MQGRDSTSRLTRVTLTRRDLLRLSGLASLGGMAALVTACGGGSATPTTAAQPTTAAAKPTTAPTQAAAATAAPTAAAAQPTAGASQAPAANTPSKFKEAPTLADQVKAGKLPPVEQRVPKNPLVLTPVEKAGTYGNTWRTALVGGQDTAWLTRTIGYQNLIRWDPQWQKTVPNIAESFESSPDAKEFTFKLRDGMKWSDGQPFGVDDVLFYAEDVYGNSELTTSKGSNPFTVTKVDDLTFKITFQKPNGLFLKNLATPTGQPSGEEWARYPAHYLKQFHKKYADPAKLDQLIKQNNADSWVKLFQLKGSGVPGTPYDARWSNPDLPTLYAWKIVEPYGAGNRVATERNPYFWKVDAEGNQLPYIDKVAYDVLQDPQPLILKISNGEVDMHVRHVNNAQNKSVFAQNQQKGNYHFFDEVPASMNTTTIAFNLTHKDPALRKLFQDKNFRIALSHAINRQQIIDTVFVSQGEPWQTGPRKESPYYNETLAKQYTEYDVAKANQILDQAGYKKGSDGQRLRLDGQKISFSVEVTSILNPFWTDVLKIVLQNWQAVGVNAQLKPEDRSLLYTRKGANEHDCVIWGGDGGMTDAILDPRWYFPFSDESNYAEAWYVWYQKPSNPQTQPEEPPEATKKQMDLYTDGVLGTGDEAKQTEAFKQILQIAQDQFYVIGISLPGNGYGIQKNTFHNVPKSMPGAWLYPDPAPTDPSQYYLDKS